jgi:hemoglobin/transferrin/lactoferrin receptor protein
MTVSVLSEITISANRWEQDIRDVPGRISTIKNSWISFQNPQTAADVLASSGGVYVQKSQLGGGSPMIRGFATNRILLVLDGVRMNTAIFRSGNVQNVISFDANAIQEAEVLFGPGAVMYGSDAIGGVVDFHTLKPAFADQGKTLVKGNGMARYSSASNERTGHFDVNLARGKWSSLTSVTRSNYGDLKMGSNGPDEYLRPAYVVRVDDRDEIETNKDPERQVHTGFDQWNAMQKISFRPQSDLELTYGFHYSKTSDNPRYDRLILAENNVLANAEWYYGPQKWLMNSLTTSFTRNVRLFDEAKIVLASQLLEESRHNRGFGSLKRTDRTEGVSAFSVNADLNKKLSKISTIFFGGEFVTNKIDSRARRIDVVDGTISGASTRYPDDAVWRSAAVYSGIRLNPSVRWTHNVSARLTSIYSRAEFDRTYFDFPFSTASLRNTSLNGAIGTVFNPRVDLKLYANLSTGFRAPNIDDSGKVFDSEPGTVVVPNPDLEAETAYNAEVGITGFIFNHLRIDFAAYYTVMENAIARANATFRGQDSIDYDGVRSRVLSLQNVNAITIAGIQAGMEFQLNNGFSVRSNANYQTGKEKSPGGGDLPPAHVAPFFGSTHFIYDGGRFKTDVYADYNGSVRYAKLAASERADHHLYAKDNDGKPYAPAWWTLNIKCSAPLGELFILDAGVENILDKRYRPYSSGISAPGRNFLICLRVKF